MSAEAIWHTLMAALPRGDRDKMPGYFAAGLHPDPDAPGHDIWIHQPRRCRRGAGSPVRAEDQGGRSRCK